MRKTAHVEILVIGNEILTGDIQDTNSKWLCKMVHARGGVVSRVTVLPDEAERIAEAVQKALARQVDVLFTSGGLGPTVDDLTLQAVAEGTGRELILHPEAHDMVRSQYEFFYEAGLLADKELTPAREKMAWLPAGGQPLVNRGGTAPGVLLQVDDSAIIVAPGVPAEFQDIVGNSAKKFLDTVFGEGSALSRCVAVKGNDESLLEPVLSQIVMEYPSIYTKSLANALGEKPELDIIMTITGEGEKEVMLDKAFTELCDGISKLGFPLRVKCCPS